MALRRGEHDDPSQIAASEGWAYLKVAVATAFVVTLAALAACGGGDSGTTSTPSTPAPTTTPTSFNGPITGFGSIFVNDVRIDNSSARTTLDDDNPNAGADDLRLGMVVEVQGECDNSGATGRAASITSRSVVQGPVTTVNTAAGSF